MTISLLRWQWLAAPLLVFLSACSSGGDDEEDEFEIDDADGTGVWNGTNTPGGGSASNATVIVAPSGRFVVATSAVFLSGSGTSSGNSFTGSATGWPPANSTFANGSTVANFTLTGTLFEGGTLNGTYSGANESGTLSLTYDTANSNRSASLATVAGTYTTQGSVTTVAINSNGSFTLNSTLGPAMNCIGNGTFSVPDATRNVYIWNMTMSGCFNNGAADGLAYLLANNTLLVMLGRTSGSPFSLAGTK